MRSLTAATFSALVFVIGVTAVVSAEKAGNPSSPETVLYSFQNNPDGATPWAGLIADRAGNLYGTTYYGGPCCGTVYELSPPSLPGGSWTEQVLYSFQGGNDGGQPTAVLIMDGHGNLYGTTSNGGDGSSACTYHCGGVFELTPPAQPGGAWIFTALYAFQGGSDGAAPMASLLRDPGGNLYGTTSAGGDMLCTGGCGTVFELFPPSAPGGAWAEKVLYSFHGWPDGYYPMAGLVFDAQGNLYGTTIQGGKFGGNLLCEGGCGTVFELLRPQPGHAWTKTEIYLFGGTDGVHPSGNLIVDGAGNFYGTTQMGGIGACSHRVGCGNIYELSPPSQSGGAWTATNLYAFHGQESGEGYSPMAGVIRDGLGNLYGTTLKGGSSKGSAAGTVFKLTRQPDGSYTKSQFDLSTVSTGAQNPQGGLMFGPGKAVTGTGSAGGEVWGAVFSITP
jgi:uncharacterized repeat protein (TIGR03803 family)